MTRLNVVAVLILLLATCTGCAGAFTESPPDIEWCDADWNETPYCFGSVVGNQTAAMGM